MGTHNDAMQWEGTQQGVDVRARLRLPAPHIRTESAYSVLGWSYRARWIASPLHPIVAVVLVLRRRVW